MFQNFESRWSVVVVVVVFIGVFIEDVVKEVPIISENKHLKAIGDDDATRPFASSWKTISLRLCLHLLFVSFSSRRGNFRTRR